MRNPTNVLNSLAKHGSDPAYKFERLYRNLFNKEMFYVAYQNIYAKEGNMTEGSDGKTIDAMSLSRIETLIEELRNESYQPNPSRRTYIPKKNGGKRPLGIPSFDDKLIQEVVRMMLEAIYEARFEKTSHGFRPNRSCHTALEQIQRDFIGVKWFVEGDIKGFFDNIDHNILIEILKERIADDRFIRLVRKFLKAGYVEDWKFIGTYSGTPQGGIISPILANIYLDKLDKYMNEYIKGFDKGKLKRQTKESIRFANRRAKLAKQLKTAEDKSERRAIIKEMRAIEQERMKYPACMEMDETYRRLRYVRYADDFLIGVVGSKEDSVKIKEEIKKFLNEKLLLELSEEKTLITHGNDKAKFLSYHIYVRKSNAARRNSLGSMIRTFGKRLVLELPIETIKAKLVSYKAVKFEHKNGHEVWTSLQRKHLINNDDLEILHAYNSEIRGLYNYYSIANNSSSMNSFKYIMEYSMYKTFASKYRTSVRKILSKYRQGKNFTVRYKDKKGKPKATILYNSGFKRKMKSFIMVPDMMPNTNYVLSETSLIDRLRIRECELCGQTDNLEMHHTRRLKDLKGKSLWEQKMLSRNRKTLALCHKCHMEVHHGK